MKEKSTMEKDSMEDKTTDEVKKAICEAYLDRNPVASYTYRPYGRQAIVRGPNYRYRADLAKLLPEAPPHSFAYIWGRYRSRGPSELEATLIPFGPVAVHGNGKLVARSDIRSERYGSPISVHLEMQDGENDIVLECEKTLAGFGAEFGTWVGKLDYYFTIPHGNREGMAHSLPTAKPLEGTTERYLEQLPWLPRQEAGNSIDSWDRLFPERKTGTVLLALADFIATSDTTPLCLSEGGTLCVDGVEIENGNTTVSRGNHSIVIVSDPKGPDSTPGFSIQGEGSWQNALLSEDSPYIWSYAGPFTTKEEALQVVGTDTVFPTCDGLSFWRLDFPDGWVRIYNDNPLFGHWNYPLGVTLYGLCLTERTLMKSNPDLSKRLHAYLEAHLQATTGSYAYALWDRDTFGGATAVHHLMTSLDSLDDCGSFCSTVLEVAKDHDVGNMEPVVQATAEHILQHQSRLPDGTFWREHLMHSFHDKTMWADDLYMSVPFLVRYGQYAHDRKAIDDAARQFRGFARRLHMPERGLFSHVYDFNRHMATGIAWGRGNGWVLFSLSELLPILDKDHEQHDYLLNLFRNLSERYLQLQDKNGMWHQVLDMEDSYPETSCTAMFVASFCGGVRNHWYKQAEPFAEGAQRGWQALKRYAVDKEGHVKGVCRGSEFSFSPYYYAERLLPRLDDTHGIGIVLIAADEITHLQDPKNGKEERQS